MPPLRLRRALLRWLPLACALLAGVALAGEPSEAFRRGEACGRGLGGVLPLFAVLAFRLGGLGWLRSLGAAVLPAFFGWGVWRNDELSPGLRWFALGWAVLQVLGFGLGVAAGVNAGRLRREPASAEEKRVVFRAGFLRRCGAVHPADVCECVAQEAWSSRDEVEQKRLAFGLQAGALELWLGNMVRACALAGDGGLPAGGDAGATREAPVARGGDGLGLTPPCAVSSTPPGAVVKVDGVVKGLTPVTVKLAATKKNTVEVQLEGFFPEARVLEPNTNEATAVDVHFRPAVRLEVTSRPAGAAVLVGGEVVLEKTPGLTGPLPPGEVDVVVRRDGYEAVARRVKLVAQQESLAVELVEGVKVSVTSEPSGADVRLDGRQVGQAPLDVYVTPKGKHTLEVGKRGWSSVKKVLSRPKAGQRVAAKLTFVALAQAQRALAAARKAADRANAALARLQQQVPPSGEPSPSLRRQLDAAEAAMTKAADALQLAEVELARAKAQRDPP